MTGCWRLPGERECFGLILLLDQIGSWSVVSREGADIKPKKLLATPVPSPGATGQADPPQYYSAYLLVKYAALSFGIERGGRGKQEGEWGQVYY